MAEQITNGVNGITLVGMTSTPLEIPNFRRIDISVKVDMVEFCNGEMDVRLLASRMGQAVRDLIISDFEQHTNGVMLK